MFNDFIKRLILDLIKGQVKDIKLKYKLEKSLNEYLERQKDTFDETEAPNNVPDFDILGNYICTRLINDIETYLWGTLNDTIRYKETIINKAIYFARSESILSDSFVSKTVSDCIEIVSQFFMQNLDSELQLIVNDIKRQQSLQNKETNSHLKDIHNSIIDFKEVLSKTIYNVNNIDHCYWTLAKYYEFLVDRSCTIGKGSKLIELELITGIVQDYKEILALKTYGIHCQIREYLYKAMSAIDDYIRSDEISFYEAVNLQMKKRIFFILINALKQSNYDVNFNFKSYIENHESELSNDDSCMSDVKTCVSLIKDEQDNPITAFEYFSVIYGLAQIKENGFDSTIEKDSEEITKAQKEFSILYDSSEII